MADNEESPEELAAMAKRVRIAGFGAVGIALLLIIAAAFTAKVDQVNQLPLSPARLRPASTSATVAQPDVDSPDAATVVPAVP